VSAGAGRKIKAAFVRKEDYMYCLLAKIRVIRFFPLGIVYLCLLLALAACGSSSNTWHASGLSAYHLSVLAVNANQPQDIYAGSDQGVIFVSVDAGGHWQRAKTAIPHASAINALGFDASGKRLYAATASGLWMTSDGGQQWQSVAAGTLTRDSNTTQAFYPASTNTLYVGTAQHGIFMSTDAGSSWKLISSGLPTSVVVRGLNYDVYHQQLWAATAQGMYRAPASGASWSALSQGLPAHVAINSVVSASSSLIYAGTQQGIYISQDNGAHWAAKNDTLANAQITSLLLNPQSSGTVYVGTQAGAFQSTDQGGTWSSIASGLPDHALVHALVVGGSDNGHLVLALDDMYTYTNTSGNSLLNYFPILFFAILLISVYYLARRKRWKSVRKMAQQPADDTTSEETSVTPE
jgi:photosystem II stability/assembly factor-like uncharacterized protein